MKVVAEHSRIRKITGQIGGLTPAEVSQKTLQLDLAGKALGLNQNFHHSPDVSGSQHSGAGDLPPHAGPIQSLTMDHMPQAVQYKGDEQVDLVGGKLIFGLLKQIQQSGDIPRKGEPIATRIESGAMLEEAAIVLDPLGASYGDLGGGTGDGLA